VLLRAQRRPVCPLRGEGFDAAAGSFVFLPRGLPHRFWAVGPAARLLLITVPAGIEDYFREINAAAGDVERTRIGERYGIRVVPRSPPVTKVTLVNAARPGDRNRACLSV
jgi:hypothetical protein